MTAVNVVSTNAASGAENWSRHELIGWINRLLNAHIEKVEEMGSGKIYSDKQDGSFYLH